MHKFIKQLKNWLRHYDTDTFRFFSLSLPENKKIVAKTVASPTHASSPSSEHLHSHHYHQQQPPSPQQQHQLISIDDATAMTTNGGEPESLQYLKPAIEDAVAWSEGASDLLF